MFKVTPKPPKDKEPDNNIRVLVSLDEAGQMLSVSSRTVLRLSQSGILPPIVKVGHGNRINRQAVLDYIARLNIAEVCL